MTIGRRIHCKEFTVREALEFESLSTSHFEIYSRRATDSTQAKECPYRAVSDDRRIRETLPELSSAEAVLRSLVPARSAVISETGPTSPPRDEQKRARAHAEISSPLSMRHRRFAGNHSFIAGRFSDASPGDPIRHAVIRLRASHRATYFHLVGWLERKPRLSSMREGELDEPCDGSTVRRIVVPADGLPEKFNGKAANKGGN